MKYITVYSLIKYNSHQLKINSTIFNLSLQIIYDFIILIIIFFTYKNENDIQL